MLEPISVSLSGPSFSFLLYENNKCSFQQEGFLLGEIVKKETKRITDNDQEQINVSQIIKINSVIPCPQVNYFYNGIGKIDKSRIKSLLGNQFSKVVSWYNYRRMSSFKFTLRQRIVHKQLEELFEIPSDIFTCCLLITEMSDNLSTHTYTQTFVRGNKYGCDRIPMHIANLSEPNNTYQASETASETFNKIVADLEVDTKKSQGLVVINKIQNAVQKHTDAVVEELSEAEARLHEMEQEVNLLMAKFKQENGLCKPPTASEGVKEIVKKDNECTSGDSLTNEDLPVKENLPDVQKSKEGGSVHGRGRGRGRRKLATKVNNQDISVDSTTKLKRK